MRRGAGRAFLGFLLTSMLTFVLIGTCFGITLKTTVFSGDSFKDLIKNMDLGSVMEEVMLEAIEENKEEISGSEDSTTTEFDFTEAIMSEEVVSDITDIIVEGLTEDKEVDFSVVKDGCMNALTDMSEQAVEDVLNEIKNTSNVIDAESLKNNSIIKQYQEEFDIDVTTPILEQMETVYGSKSVSLDEVDVEEVKAEAKEAVKEKVMPDVEKKVDEFIEETNIEVNKEIHAFKVDNDIQSVTDIFNPIFGVILKSIIIGSVIAVVIILLQMLVYKKDMNKALKNVGISCILVAIAMFAFSFVCDFVAGMLADMFNSGSAVDNAVVSIINSTIPEIGGAAKIIALVTGILFVVLIVGAIILKNKLASKEDVKPANATFANANVATNMANPYAHTVVNDQSSNNMYGQQPMVNNMYNQQPVVNNMYNQQPVVNDMYNQQPVTNDMPVEQTPVNDSVDTTQM